ncbi:MAG TPA: HAD family hydrolase [Longimicrobiales bacterium]
MKTKILPEAPRAGGVALVLVDFDDTLVDTAPRFQQARRTFFRLLAEAGFDEATARRIHHDEVDPVMRRRYGLGPFRLEPAFRETYRRLCAHAGIRPDPATADALGALGRDVVGTPPCFPDALEALDRLARTVPTVLYTQSGTPDYQLACIREAGILTVLPPERVLICRRKTAEQFRATLARFDVTEPAAAWMIGNSIRSDVNPALSAGANAILIDQPDPWEFDLDEPVSDGFLRVRSFSEAVDHLIGSAGAPPARRRASP